ncbi:hypothetical protein Psuf_073760 [Phytohabitans suffuscus]|uniref:Uncharacterized protein n=1 Tax=Phytohabitans suffuscus TaxID=624315 RepID=A0A6F8YVP2_9ACTN|nr:hypothetical protein Psuf_073760 [Phytohabitans suffuscus]
MRTRPEQGLWTAEDEAARETHPTVRTKTDIAGSSNLRSGGLSPTGPPMWTNGVTPTPEAL